MRKKELIVRGRKLKRFLEVDVGSHERRGVQMVIANDEEHLMLKHMRVS